MRYREQHETKQDDCRNPFKKAPQKEDRIGHSSLLESLWRLPAVIHAAGEWRASHGRHEGMLIRAYLAQFVIPPSVLQGSLTFEAATAFWRHLDSDNTSYTE
jgi:hypothetical protein